MRRIYQGSVTLTAFFALIFLTACSANELSLLEDIKQRYETQETDFGRTVFRHYVDLLSAYSKDNDWLEETDYHIFFSGGYPQFVSSEHVYASGLRGSPSHNKWLSVIENELLSLEFSWLDIVGQESFDIVLEYFGVEVGMFFDSLITMYPMVAYPEGIVRDIRQAIETEDLLGILHEFTTDDPQFILTQMSIGFNELMMEAREEMAD